MTVSVPTSIRWIFIILFLALALIILVRGWLASGNAAISGTEELVKLGKCFSDKGWWCPVTG